MNGRRAAIVIGAVASAAATTVAALVAREGFRIFVRTLRIEPAADELRPVPSAESVQFV
jgi:hypothetical protein